MFNILLHIFFCPRNQLSGWESRPSPLQPAARAPPRPSSPNHLVRHAVPTSQLQAVAAEVDSSDGFEHTAGAEQTNAVNLEEVRHLYDSANVRVEGMRMSACARVRLARCMPSCELRRGFGL